MTHRMLLGAFLLLFGTAAPCQLSRSTMPTPNPYVDPAFFDEARGVLVCWGTNVMWEFDGTNWTVKPCTAFPNYPVGASAYDPVRHVLVAIDYLVQQPSTWEWDGVNWTNRGPAPLQQPVWSTTYDGNCLMTFHETRQNVMLFASGAGLVSGLWDWDGAVWTMLNHVNPPPTRLTPNSWWSYLDMAYDSRWDKIVLFGRAMHNTGGTGGPSEQVTFEWDPVNDWAQLATLPGAPSGTVMWYDRHRGTLLRAYSGAPYGAYYRDLARNWMLLQSTALNMGRGAFDSQSNRYYAPDNASTIAVIHDTHPAAFGGHLQGCAPATPWPLQLSATWTRAWIGRSMSVDVTAPHSLALLAMGFSDQSYNAMPLPIDLSLYGMPGCSLTIAPQATVLGTNSSGTVTFSLPVPSASGLLGTVYWQQAFPLALGANAANLLATDSVRGTVGAF